MENLLRHIRSESRCGRTIRKDALGSERPIEVTVPEINAKIYEIVLGYRRAKLRDIARTAKISHERAADILHQHLHMKKLPARFSAIVGNRPKTSKNETFPV